MVFLVIVLDIALGRKEENKLNIFEISYLKS